MRGKTEGPVRLLVAKGDERIDERRATGDPPARTSARHSRSMLTIRDLPVGKYSCQSVEEVCVRRQQVKPEALV